MGGLPVPSCEYLPKRRPRSRGGFNQRACTVGKNGLKEAQGASGVHGMGAPLPLHLRDALREVERHVVHLRVVIVWRAAQQVGLSEQASLAAQVGLALRVS